jgi:hypothetical protein
VKINNLENDRKVEDIRVDVRFDGWEAKKTGCAWFSQACCLLAVLKIKVHFQKCMYIGR